MRIASGIPFGDRARGPRVFGLSQIPAPEFFLGGISALATGWSPRVGAGASPGTGHHSPSMMLTFSDDALDFV